jgi:transcriptional regulator with XRE-family HTH domain
VTLSVFSRKYERLRAVLVAARKDAGLTQAQLAKKLSRPQSFVSKYENGERRLDVVEYIDVARALNLDPAALLQRISGSPAKGEPS